MYGTTVRGARRGTLALAADVAPSIPGRRNHQSATQVGIGIEPDSDIRLAFHCTYLVARPFLLSPALKSLYFSSFHPQRPLQQ